MTIVLRMPWDSPPLRSNDRMHWAQKAKHVKVIRDTARIVTGRQRDIQKMAIRSPVVVTLIWEVTDKRRRDVGASAPTLKAWIDGMVDAGLLPFDHHDIVTEERLRIEYGATKGVRIEIEPSRIAEVIPQLTEGQQ